MTISIFFFRHGEAFQIGEKDIRTDEERPLTPRGKSTTEEVCTTLARMNIQPGLIWTSPLVRALETAEIISQQLECTNLIEKVGLAYANEEDALFLEMSNLKPDTTLFVVGHQPTLGNWICHLTTGMRHGDIALSKSGVARIDLLSQGPPARGELRWLMTAKQLRRHK